MVLARHTDELKLCGRARLSRLYGRRPQTSRRSICRHRLPDGGPRSWRGNAPDPDRASRRRGRPVPSLVRVDAGRGRRQVRVPDQRRRRHELAGARQRQGRLLHAQHARDAAEDDPERDLLLARPGDQRRRRDLELDRAALVQEALEPPAGSAEPELRRLADIPDEPGRADVVGGPRRGALPRLGRERSDARLARPQVLEPGRSEGATERRRDLRRDHRFARARVVLLERHAGGRRGEPRRLDARRLVQLVVADGDDDPARGSEPRARGVRSAVLVGSGAGRRALRGRDQLVRRLRSGLQGLLHRLDDRDLALADDRSEGQRLLLARPGARS